MPINDIPYDWAKVKVPANDCQIFIRNNNNSPYYIFLILCIMFGCVIQPLLADHARDGATSSKWPTETVRAVAVGHVDGVAQAQTLEQTHQGRGLRAGGR